MIINDKIQAYSMIHIQTEKSVSKKTIHTSQHINKTFKDHKRQENKGHTLSTLQWY